LNKGFWLKIVAKMLVIMSLPTAIVTYSSGIGFNWFYSATLFLIQGSSYPVPPPYPGFGIPDVRIIISVLILCCPGVVFNYWLTLQAHERSIRNHLLAIVVIIIALASVLTPLLALSPIDPWLLYPNSLEFATSWILVVFVLMPVFTREGSVLRLVWSQSRAPILRLRGIQLRGMPSKGEAIGFLMGICSLLVPFSIDLLLSDAWGPYMDIRGPFWTGTLGFLSEFDYDFTRFSLYPAPITINPFSLTQFFAGIYTFLIPRLAFGILFGHSVLRYLQSRASEKRTLVLAVLSIVVPFLCSNLMPILFPRYLPQFGRFYIPLPFLQVIGLLMMYRVKIALMGHEVNGDIKDMPELREEEVEADSTLEPTPRVDIPTLYRIKSRIQNLRQEEKNSDKHSDSQP